MYAVGTKNGGFQKLEKFFAPVSIGDCECSNDMKCLIYHLMGAVSKISE